MPKESSNRIIQYNMDHITDTAMELFFSKGIRETSVNGIAKAGDISRVTIYKYFPTKLDIAELAYSRFLYTKSPCIQNTFFSEKYKHLNGFEQIRLQLSIYAEMHLENPAFLPFLSELIILLCEDETIRETNRISCLTYKKFNDLYFNALRNGIQEGSINNKFGFEEVDYLFVRKLMEGICLKEYLFYGREYFFSHSKEIYDMLISAADNISIAFFKP